MNAKNCDVLVVGGGLAGCIAAKAALDAGKKVTMIFPNGGASELVSGDIGILGVIPGDKSQVCENYDAGIEALLEKYPDHPYRYYRDYLDKGLAALDSLTEKAGYAYTGFSGKNVWLPNMMGTFSPTAYVPDMLKDTACLGDTPQRVLVVGIKGNAGFNAHYAALAYQEYQQRIQVTPDQYFSTVIQLDSLSNRKKLSDGELADYFDTDAGMAELAEKLSSFCQNNRYTFDKILLPPVLGYIRYQEVLAKIKAACGCRAGEVASMGNSVVGFRFTRAMYRGLEESGVQLIRGAVVEALHDQGGQIVADCLLGLVDQLHPGEKIPLRCSVLILATGGFLGGGIQGRHKEVWINLLEENLGQIPRDEVEKNLFVPAGHGFLKYGAQVNSDLSVKDGKFNNRVFACGSLLAGYNGVNERSGGGVAVASAYLAGQAAASKA